MDKIINDLAGEACKRSICPAASALDILGDKWTLLVVRDLLLGKKTYGELQDSPEKVPTNILADRLKRLERAGLLVKNPYQQRPVRYSYQLTEKGTDLEEVLQSLMVWADKHIPGTLPLAEVEKRMAEAQKSKNES